MLAHMSANAQVCIGTGASECWRICQQMHKCVLERGPANVGAYASKCTSVFAKGPANAQVCIGTGASECWRKYKCVFGTGRTW